MSISTGTELWRNTPLKPSYLKSGLAESELYHPDNALNQEYLDAGAADDYKAPLCFAVHNGLVCRRPAQKGTLYCRAGGDE